MRHCEICMTDKDDTIILFEHTDHEVRACKDCSAEAEQWFVIKVNPDAPSIEDARKCQVCDERYLQEVVRSGSLHMLVCGDNECRVEALGILHEQACEKAEEESDPDSPHHLIDGVGFADPGGSSALRAATSGNPRNLPCPNCGEPDRLTPADRAAGYQCNACANIAEGGGY